MLYGRTTRRVQLRHRNTDPWGVKSQRDPIKNCTRTRY